LYLTGVTNDRDEPALINAGIGLMVQPGNSYHLRADRYPCYGADNGAFSGKWDEDKHFAWLDRLPRSGCLFAVAPDVYPDAAATLELSSQFFGLFREMGFPVALVAQDHAEQLDLPWDDFDCLFIGGERRVPPRLEWKIGPAAERLCAVARQRGKWVHMGRVNSAKRMRRAREMGVLSVDGTFMKYRLRREAGDVGDERFGRGASELDGWCSWLRANPLLPFANEVPSHPTHRAAFLKEVA
jgi:hypothetical protein